MRPEGLGSIGDRTHNLPVCSAVPQVTAAPRTPHGGGGSSRWLVGSPYNGPLRPRGLVEV